MVSCVNPLHKKKTGAASKGRKIPMRAILTEGKRAIPCLPGRGVRFSLKRERIGSACSVRGRKKAFFN